MINYYELMTYFSFELGLDHYCAISNPCSYCAARGDYCTAHNQDSDYVPIRCYSVVW